jgi:membrane fusion protein, copper/silver efflux system
MKIRYIGILLLLIAACSFLAGYWVNHNSGGHKTGEARRILYYADPMNPAFKSDKPGIAPCGMPLEPVYADQSSSITGGADLRASMPPGTVRISPEKQQLIGVKVISVEKAPWNHTLRVLGRVVPDETRIYRVIAATSGLLIETTAVTTGSMVRKDALLAKFSPNSTEFIRALQAYLTVVNVGDVSVARDKHPQQQFIQVDKAPQAIVSPNIQKKEEMVKEVEDMRNLRMKSRVPSTSSKSSGSSSSSSSSPSSSPRPSNPTANAYRQSLFSYGIGESQIKEIERTRIIPTSIDIRSPAAGFVLLRNVSPGLSFDRGTELFRIADLSRVWVLADVFENESSFFRPGMLVKMELPYQKKTIFARMSDVLPQFDASTRTLKIRLEADNPGYAMRPDMFVNVELPVSGPPAIIVPVDAVLDSGLKKTVFVDRGNSIFEPRQVETGRSLGERVEIVRGLMPGEKIVVSGNFLLDSEARLQLASTGIAGRIGRDPVCGMSLDEDQSRSAGNFREYKGKTYFFCTPECRDDFVKDPERYLKSSLPGKPQGTPKHQHAAHDAAAEHISHDHAKAHKSQSSVLKPMPHDHMTTPMSADMKPMPPAKGGAVMPKTGDAMQMPGSGGGTVTSGPQVPAPVPTARTGGAFSPMPAGTDIKPIPQMSMPIPGAKPTPAPAMQPAARPQDVPATAQPRTDGMIPPRTGASPAELPQKDTFNGGKAHD